MMNTYSNHNAESQWEGGVGMARHETCPYACAMTSRQQDEHAALVALLQARPGGLSWAEITAGLLEVGSAVELWERHAPAPALISHPSEITPEIAAADVQSWLDRGFRLVSVLDDEYPARLRGVQEAPPVIFTLGRLVADDPGVSVVGSRDASPPALKMAADIAYGLTERKLTVVSGLARGIDAAAHRAALDAGGRTVAVIGSGISRSYPAENRALQGEIAQRGLVLSQFWPDAPPQKHTFLMRNAVMSGYGLATIVVEAGETSGARAQARMAVEHGRQVILTSQVVSRNQWAQQLVGRPGVQVAGSTGEIMEAVEQVVTVWSDLRRLVS
jgi:DNA processing protein